MEDIVRSPLRGVQILNTPLLNKGTAFTQEERNRLGLNGLLPSTISPIELQLKRCQVNLNRRRSPLGKYTYLSSLLNRNEMLFFQFLLKNPAELLPLIYTPTVGDAAVQYSMIYSNRRGVYLSYSLIDKMEEMIANIPNQDVEVIVVTDGERILGLGDQGIGGMTIPIGKLALYTVFGGIHPTKTLPILLDVGTNNAQLLQNELYIGWRHGRIQGAEYDLFVDKFIRGIKKRYPHALLQWEDFGKANAARLLVKYRTQILSFNDDIQGTGAVTLAALFSAIKVSGCRLSDSRIAILGGGSAGIGIATMILNAMMREGLSHDEAIRRLFIVDIGGLLHTNSFHVDEHQRPLLHPLEELRGWKLESESTISLMDVIRNAHPTALLGVCGQAGAFTKEMVMEMAKHTSRPIIFPLSNPTSKAECTPREAIEWTAGQAILATGSPFIPVDYLGRKYSIAQCNNVYIFPGLGLGALASKATQVTDSMFLEAAQILANFSPALHNPAASLLPAIEDVRSISREIAIGVAKIACREKIAGIDPSHIEKAVDAIIWTPHYPKLEAN